MSVVADLGTSWEREDVHKKLLDSESWPVPAWIANPQSPDRVRNFESYSAHQLRTRYVELEGDFRSIAGNFPPHDRPTAQSIFGYLQAVRSALERRYPQLLTIGSTLDLVERYMIWIYPQHILSVRLASTIARLEKLQPEGWRRYAEQLSESAISLDHRRAPLDEAIAALNRHIRDSTIASGLQIRRLQTYRNWSVLVLLVMLVVTPYLANSKQTELWPLELVYKDLISWVPVFGVLTLGMLGGFISGLLQVRSSRVSLLDYQESMVKLSLRPLFGGIVALILFIMLSWELLPAIRAQTAGAYLLVAFLSGFSERYFLRLLDVETSGQARHDAARQVETPLAMRIEPPIDVPHAGSTRDVAGINNGR